MKVERQTDKTDRQERQTDRQTDRHTDRHTYTKIRVRVFVQT